MLPRPLITGAGRGIGRAFVDEFLEAGVERIYAGVRTEAAARAVAAIDDRVVPLMLEITDPASIRTAALQAPDITVLVNNAGIQHRGSYLDQPDMAGPRAEMEVNYFAPLALARAFRPALEAAAGGAIVNILSLAALLHLPRSGPYNASKKAARALTHCLRDELEGRIRVIAVYPAGYDTDMAAHVDRSLLFPPRLLTGAVLASLRDGGPDEVMPDPHSRRVAEMLGDALNPAAPAPSK